jgi:hemerythrin-like domain-containing protein
VKRDPNLVRLTREHHKALAIALRIERDLPASDASDLETLYADLLEFWQRFLLNHFRAENECLLTRLTRHVGLDDELVARTCRDHIALDGLIVRMQDDAPARREAISRFGALIREHVHWEEDVLFERSQEMLTGEEMRALGSDLETRLPDQIDFPAERLYPKR